MPRVLLIEDDPDTGDTVKTMLEVLGHEVLWARHGREAVMLLKRDASPDAILTDILMPEMDGIESILYLHKHHPNIAVVAMTAMRDAPYLKAVSTFGARTTLFKPFGIEELREVLGEAMDN